jgi:hypothetical protein
VCINVNIHTNIHTHIISPHDLPNIYTRLLGHKIYNKITWIKIVRSWISEERREGTRKRKRKILIKWHKVQLEGVSFNDLLHDMLTTTNNALCISKLLKQYVFNILTKNKLVRWNMLVWLNLSIMYTDNNIIYSIKINNYYLWIKTKF